MAKKKFSNDDLQALQTQMKALQKMMVSMQNAAGLEEVPTAPLLKQKKRTSDVLFEKLSPEAREKLEKEPQFCSRCLQKKPWKEIGLHTEKGRILLYSWCIACRTKRVSIDGTPYKNTREEKRAALRAMRRDARTFGETTGTKGRVD